MVLSGRSRIHMRNIFQLNLLILSILLIVVVCGSDAFASNLSVSNVSISARNPSAKTLTAQFDISWENAWKTKINHDAVWITVRLHKAATNPVDKRLCTLTTSGLNPLSYSVGSASDLDMYVPADKLGMYLRLRDFGIRPSVESQGVAVEIDFQSCGFSVNDSVFLSVVALEMVHIPRGAFHAGDYATSSASFVQGSGDSDPWYITGAGPISVSNPSADGFLYVSAGNAGESATGSSFSISADYPKGHEPFYMMKYEITEGQWVDFVNALPSAATRAKHDLTDSNHKNTDTVQARNTISCSGSPLTCSTQRPHRAIGYLNWMNVAAFLDWAALRPMTELEFEKAARGPVLPEEGEYAWGQTLIVAATELSAGDEGGSEQVVTPGANAHYGNMPLSGGDAAYGIEYTYGPLRSGIFAGESSDRTSAGASYYGVMELSGNLWERVVAVGTESGRNYTGTHGDGKLSTAAGFEGYANETDWPGMDNIPARGVTGASGAGFKGGSYNDQSGALRLRISDRQSAAANDASSLADSGGRGVRTDDEN